MEPATVGRKKKKGNAWKFVGPYNAPLFDFWVLALDFSLFRVS